MEFEGLSENTEQDVTTSEEVEQNEFVQEEEAPVIEESGNEVVQESVQQEPVQYTEAELTEIIKNDGEVDTSRLSSEGRALMKAMQRGFTPKLEEAAAIRRELQEMRDAFEAAKPQREPETLEEAYDQNPQSVLRYLDDELQKLIQDDPIKNAANIEQVRNVKQSLALREVNNLRSKAQATEKAGQYMQQMVAAIPDLQSKQSALAKFAIEVLNYSQEELSAATNPMVAGEAAVKNVMRINAAYDKFNAGKTIPSKQAQKKATPVEPPGSVSQPKQTDQLGEIKRKAMNGEASWSDYFMNLEE